MQKYNVYYDHYYAYVLSYISRFIYQSESVQVYTSKSCFRATLTRQRVAAIKPQFDSLQFQLGTAYTPHVRILVLFYLYPRSVIEFAHPLPRVMTVPADASSLVRDDNFLILSEGMSRRKPQHDHGIESDHVDNDDESHQTFGAP